MAASLAAQEAVNPSSTRMTEVSGDKNSHSIAVAEDANNIIDTNAARSNAASSSSTSLEVKEPSAVASETVATNSEKSDNGTNAAPEVSPDALSPVTPTDPSMIPPSESTNVEANQPLPNDPNVMPLTSPEEARIPVNSTESIEKKKEQIKLRYYEVRTQVEKETEVVALRLKADKAASDEEKRQDLRAYYDLLFQRMKKIDSSISDRCDLMQAAYLRHLEQVSIEPTIPLNPPPSTNSASNNTQSISPINSKTKKKKQPAVVE